MLVVEYRGHFVGADVENFLVRARTYELRADRERIGESGASRGKVESPGVLGADTILHQAGCSRKKHVRRYAREDNHVDFGGIGVGAGQDLFGGFGGQVRGSHAWFGDVAFPNAGARADPFIAGLYDLGEVA